MNVSPQHIDVLKAALIELDKQWRRGTANAGFQDKTMALLRPVNGRPVHESTPQFLLQLLEKPGTRLTLTFEEQDDSPVDLSR